MHTFNYPVNDFMIVIKHLSSFFNKLRELLII